MPRPITPLIAVDIIIELAGHPKGSIVLIERRNPPYGWALPGGFVDIGERLEQTALREAFEETGLQVSLKLLLGCYSAPERDPRGHTVSAVYVAEARGEPQALDDAKNVGVFSCEHPPELAFDHALILADYRMYRAGKGVAPLRIGE